MTDTLPRFGDRVRFLGGNKRTPGEVVHIIPSVVGDVELSTGAPGVVITELRGYPQHPCPNHGEELDCLCGEEGPDPGWIPAVEPSVVAVFATSKPSIQVRRVLHLSDEGDYWERG